MFIRVLPILLLGVGSASAALPVIPSTNEVVKYEYGRLSPGDTTSEIPRGRGDALLSALKGGLREAQPHIVQHETWDPPPPAVWLNLDLTNGSVYNIGITGDAGMAFTPDSVLEPKDAAHQEAIAKVMKQLDDDLRQRILDTPKPFVYTVGTIDDGGTLSGIARLFYHDTTKWKVIFQANGQAIKNPNVIAPGLKLMIPKLN